MPQRNFENQKALIDYAEQNGLVYVWELAKRQRLRSSVILTNVVPDETVALRGVEHHTFACSECHVTEHRVVFIKDGRDTESPPMPMQAARRLKRASTEQDEHVVAPGFLSRVLALVRRQQVRA